jgi:hypothetical protein
VVAKLRYRYTQASDLLTKRKDEQIKRQEAEKDPERRKALEIHDFMQKNTKVFEAGSIEAMTDDELSSHI